MEFKGAYTALITPFKEDYAVDYEKLEDLVEFQVENGISGIVVCGTTGETPTLSEEEYKKVIKTVVDKVAKRVQVIAGAGANSTKKAIELTKICKELGADAVLSTCPYYNKPTQRGIQAHYEAISSAVDIPLIIYNVPGRTGSNVLPETIEKLSHIPNIVGVKEASGSLEQMIEIRKLCRKNFNILSGEDHLIMPMSAVGCRGVISVIANILPKKVSEFYNLQGEEKEAMHEYLYDISRNLFIEGNPVTVKEAMDILGLASNRVRLPLISAEPKTREKLKNLFKLKGLL
ncbi:4-hydroxy-tetrahydrodipicolinate synthase [Sneathia sanguinegens]|uniref:4-hydroxy-tetrahydrodipicolinate synthase n=1 Tax=Sneathia sanguinegens TaxID=40543 RepID=A0ABT7HMC0_9FUSO|nr:4-hydroxy-tetrahydrodipicolinate synthase [Sneathia sanguinegens]MDK9580976.1 4-hydroxy-tetrahydrodipicolinate synthase [Sneathia sanguinegens]